MMTKMTLTPTANAHSWNVPLSRARKCTPPTLQTAFHEGFRNGFSECWRESGIMLACVLQTHMLSTGPPCDRPLTDTHLAAWTALSWIPWLSLVAFWESKTKKQRGVRGSLRKLNGLQDLKQIHLGLFRVATPNLGACTLGSVLHA